MKRYVYLILILKYLDTLYRYSKPNIKTKHMINTRLRTLLWYLSITIAGTITTKAQIGIGTTAPNAALDVTSTTDGLLIPRVALTITTAATPLTTPTTSEMVYNTATVADVTPGYYYWDGTKWVRLLSTIASNWSSTGNSGTTAGTNFIGTTDAIDFVTKTNNTEKTRVTSAGNVGIGTTTPAAKLDIAAGVTTTNSLVNATGSFNDFLQFNVQNTSTGTRAQSGYSATADNGTATTGFAWMGINNSTFNYPTAYNIGGANDVTYVGSGQDLHIANANNTKSIILSTGKATTPFFDERMRIINNGNVGIGTATPAAKLDVAAGTTTVNSAVNATGSINDFLQFNIQNTSTGTRAQSGYSATADNGTATTGFAWMGINNSTFNFPTAYNVGGANDVTYVASGQDMYIANANNTKSIIFSTGIATTPFFSERMRVRSDGSVGINNTGAATEKLKVTHTGSGNDAINAVNNDSNVGKGNAVWATNANATGTSIIASSGATPPNVLPTLGAGLSGSHVDGYGVYANTGNGDPNNSAHNGHAAGGFLLDNDNSVASSGSSAFAKLAGKDNASPDGVLGAQNILYGGYFQGGVSGTSYSYAGIKYNHNASGGGGTNYKVIGNGTASTLIPDDNNTMRVMFCPEAPEVLFEDYGVATLSNGEAYITLDKILAASMKIDNNHPLKVFIQLEGDCNGVYVTEKSANGFRVKELNQGNSNVSFSWHIVGSRADSKDASGRVNSEFENLRLPIGPSMLKPDVLLTKDLK